MKETLLGEPKEKLSVSRHAIVRFRERINKGDVNTIKAKLKEITENGERIQLDDNHYKVIFNDISIITKQISPLHKIILTTYPNEDGVA